MIDFLTRANTWLNSIVWGPPMLVLLVGTGVLLTILTGAVQFRRLGTSLAEVLGKLRRPGAGEGSVTPFQAVATALASTVGAGNIAGVATAIAWVDPARVLDLGLRRLRDGDEVPETVVAIQYRERDSDRRHARRRHVYPARLGLTWLGVIFAMFTALAAFGIGNMVQANSVARASRQLRVPPAGHRGHHGRARRRRNPRGHPLDRPRVPKRWCRSWRSSTSSGV